MKTFLLTTLIASSIMMSAPSFAARGNSSGGGGNTLNGLLIEDYATPNPYEVLPELKTAEDELLEKIKILSPDFANELKANVNNRTWYVIPKMFNELSADRTGLHFETEQPAYQNNEEIFLSLPQISKMAFKNRALLFQHEIIMTGIEDKDESGHASVRKIMHLLEKPGITEVEFCNKLRQYGFGEYVTKTEKENLQSLKKAYRQALEAKCTDESLSDDSIQAIKQQAQAMTNNNGHTTAVGRQIGYDQMMIILGDSFNQYEQACSNIINH